MGKYRNGITLAKVAAEAGVSPGAASAVLRNVHHGRIRVSQEAAERVRSAAEKLNYRPSAASRAMSSRRTKQIGVLLPNRSGHEGTSPMSFETILGINDGLQPFGYIMTLVRMHDILGELSEESRIFREQAIDGIVVLGALPDGVRPWLESRFEHIVWCDSNVWKPENCIRRDETNAGRLTAGKLLDAGYDRILWADTPFTGNDHYSKYERRAGVAEAAVRLGAKLSEMSISDNFTWDPAAMDGTAIVAGSHPAAEQICLSAMRAKRAPGKDFSIAGCDDPHFTSWTLRRLSRV